ncbi:MAG: hypothetical protein ACOX08_01455 [Methanobacterium sp.]
MLWEWVNITWNFIIQKHCIYSSVSFPIYIFHIVWVNFFIYYTVKWIHDLMVVEIIFSLIFSFILTIATIEVVRRIPGIRTLFSIKA